MANQYLNALSDVWNNAGTTFQGISLNVTNSASAADSKLLRLQVGSVDQFSVSKAGVVTATGAITSGGAVLVASNDGGALGASGTAFSDLFLASGAVINFLAGDVTITHSANTLAFAGASSGYTFTHALLPSADDAAALGAAATSWSDAFFASGAVLNFANGNYTITHASGTISLSGTLDLGHATDTTLSRGAAGFLAVEGNRVPSPASQAAGDILYRGSTEWERLAKGTAAQLLAMNAGATAPEWVTAATAGAVPVGTIAFHGATTAPSGWLLCYGQAISRATYSALFTSISTTYGVGDGTTTFNVPDLRGRVIAGQDDMGGTSANRLTGVTGSVDGDVLGGTGGTETHTLIIAEMPAHTHSVELSQGSAAASGSSQSGINADSTSGSTGGGGAHNNVQPTIILNAIIYAGV